MNSLPIGLDRGQFWWRTFRFNWFGHQSGFDLPPPAACLLTRPFTMLLLSSVIISLPIVRWFYPRQCLEYSYVHLADCCLRSGHGYGVWANAAEIFLKKLDLMTNLVVVWHFLRVVHAAKGEEWDKGSGACGNGGVGKKGVGRQEEQHIPDLLFHPAQMIL